MRRCHGYHIQSCHCGGDLCLCGRDGEECMGCPDCEGDGSEDSSEPDAAPAGTYRWHDEDDGDDFNPDACPECGSDEAGALICSQCGCILIDDSNDELD
ncbi:hypothetical protein HER32_11900 [Hymenobacter sp. BT18]|uniref:hypothetical protein n=1 Tax=Hymenobacter sp. BT18 TaxID=2835648 RepID=UPI00143E2665|nr:hypothetical protein [Hymenobacter sp. BT18]QIX61845.1 hypothetical protein HER32_11900 [Hymenobacter sp. BT18]